MVEKKIKTEAELRARHAQELRELRAEQKRIERRDDRDEKHLAKWLRTRHYDEFRRLAEQRDEELAARREQTKERVTQHREERVTTASEEGVTQHREEGVTTASPEQSNSIVDDDLFGGDDGREEHWSQ